MSPEIIVLSLSAAAIAFLHTLLGPDHYLPFVAMAKSRGWTLRKTVRITLICGLGHLAGSVALGILGIYLGLQLASLQWLESVRGNLAAWLLIGFGLTYTAWGLRQAYRKRPHRHWHSHGGLMHNHEHGHHAEHAHVHDASGTGGALAPWLIFVIFVLGPCEPLIPLLMYPAARESISGVMMVTAIFGVVTVMTMVLAVTVASLGLRAIRLQRFERYGHALAGGAILACGLGVAFLGI
jgi:ABC-type nickel/cobalt efflux system permease component RcnA